ncbi:hypothetical protein ACLBU0_09795, partial [Pseudomonas aeruginosa]
LRPAPRHRGGHLDALERTRSAWGVFRDRRPNLYGPLKTLDGSLES